MRIRMAAYVVVLLLLPSLAARANATSYSDLTSFLAATDPLTLIDFNAAASGDIGATYAALGVTFPSGNHFAQCLTFSSSPPDCWVSDSSDPYVPGVFEANFTVAGITAVGMNNARNAGVAQLRVFDAGDNLIEMVNSDALDDTLDFFGIISSTPIARITVQYLAPVDGWAVDDLRFGTPEPSMMALVVTGCLSLWCTVRRRRPTSSLPDSVEG